MASTPPSTPPSLGSASPIQASPSATLDDIFSTSPTENSIRVNPAAHPSDIPRLRQVHATAGYRAGISQSKTDSLQPGFDEGYSLGATFGWQIGCLIGELKGLVSLYHKQRKTISDDGGDHIRSTTGNEQDSQSDEIRLRKLLREAQAALTVECIFGKQYWKEDGTWGYEVGGVDGEDVGSFQEVVEAHPVILKWAKIVETEVESAGLCTK